MVKLLRLWRQMSTHYKEGYNAGRDEFESFIPAINPYPVGSEAHEEFERGWIGGYDGAIEDCRLYK